MPLIQLMCAKIGERFDLNNKIKRTTLFYLSILIDIASENFLLMIEKMLKFETKIEFFLVHPNITFYALREYKVILIIFLAGI